MQETLFRKPPKLYVWMHMCQFIECLRPSKASYLYCCLIISGYWYHISYNKLALGYLNLLQLYNFLSEKCFTHLVYISTLGQVF